MLELQKTIGYSFKEKSYLEIALTHSSYANESRHAQQNNERQEFLGDAVLSIIVSDYIFRHLKVPEGELTKIRASMVCENALAGFANKIEVKNGTKQIFARFVKLYRVQCRITVTAGRITSCRVGNPDAEIGRFAETAAVEKTPHSAESMGDCQRRRQTVPEPHQIELGDAAVNDK